MDILYVQGDVDGLVQLADGTNALYVGGNITNNVVGGNDQDQIFVNSMSNGGIALGDGDDNFYLGTGYALNFSAGAGNDVVYIGATIADFLYLDGGNDVLYYSGALTSLPVGGLDGGTGTDTIYLPNYTAADWSNNVDLIQDKVVGFENIALSDGAILGNPQASDFTWNAFVLNPIYY